MGIGYHLCETFDDGDAGIPPLRRLVQMINRQLGTTDSPPTDIAGPKVGFLFNHDELHQVAHTAPVIPALQRMLPNLQIEIWTSNDAQQEAVARQLSDELPRPIFHRLDTSPTMNLLEAAVLGLAPLGRIGRLARSAARLNELDAIIIPETTSALLKTRFGATYPRLIFLPHGAGDRSISVSPAIADFDYLLLPGEKTRARMIELGLAAPDTCAVIGYPKFESRPMEEYQSLFDNDRPTVLYNPHFDPILSSWHEMGFDVLDFFGRQDQFNLIFAPHVMLFRRAIQASVEHRRIRLRKAIPERYFSMPHIKIDLGSSSSVDMTYTSLSDIYLGDVSSQVYEFIKTPRPVIFLNSHNADWKGNADYAFWSLGPVIDTVQDLGEALANALPFPEEVERRQIDAFERTFDVSTKMPSADRAARSIIEFLSRDFAAMSCS